MRIISGKYKNKLLFSPNDNQIRPTMDRAKEGLFNVIGVDIVNSIFIDFYSGTGNIGIEALSRGASKVIFIDNNPQAIKLIKLNTQNLDVTFEIFNANISQFEIGMMCDIMFFDPPYNIDLSIFKKNIEKNLTFLNSFGQVVIELDKECFLEFNKLRKFKCKKYGKTVFTFYDLIENE